MSEKRIGEPITVLSVKARKDGVKIVLSSGEKLVLSPDAYTEFRLYENKELSEEELKNLLSYANQDGAYDLAIRYLSKESYCRSQLLRKLISKGYEYPVVLPVLKRLEEAGLIDDETYAKTFAEDVGELRLIGANRIYYELRSKGISEEIIAKLSFPREKELEKATRYATGLDRRYYRTPYTKKKLKIYSALLARGFDESVAYETSEQATSASDPGIERIEIEKAYHLAEAKFSRKYDGYELRQHIYAALVRKGFSHDEVKSIMEEMQS